MCSLSLLLDSNHISLNTVHVLGCHLYSSPSVWPHIYSPRPHHNLISCLYLCLIQSGHHETKRRFSICGCLHPHPYANPPKYTHIRSGPISSDTLCICFSDNFCLLIAEKNLDVSLNLIDRNLLFLSLYLFF